MDSEETCIRISCITIPFILVDFRQSSANKAFIASIPSGDYEVVHPFQIRDKNERIGIGRCFSRNFMVEKSQISIFFSSRYSQLLPESCRTLPTCNHRNSKQRCWTDKVGPGTKQLHIPESNEFPQGTYWIGRSVCGSFHGSGFHNESGFQLDSSGEHGFSQRVENCYYQGTVAGDASSFVALSSCNGLRYQCFLWNFFRSHRGLLFVLLRIRFVHFGYVHIYFLDLLWNAISTEVLISLPWENRYAAVILQTGCHGWITTTGGRLLISARGKIWRVTIRWQIKSSMRDERLVLITLVHVRLTIDI